MAGSVNRVILLGNLGGDPDVRSTQAGSKIVSFSLATSESWNDKASGDRKEKTEWHKVVIFNDALGNIAEKYLRKGSKVYVEGQLQTRKWTDQSGVDRYSTEVALTMYKSALVLLDPRQDGGGTHGRGSSRGAAPSDDPDDIPF